MRFEAGMLKCSSRRLPAISSLILHSSHHRTMLTVVGFQRMATSAALSLTRLHFAALYGHKKAVRAEIHQGTEVDTKDKHGVTPLMLACLSGSYRVAEYLVSHGASLGSVDVNGHDATAYAKGRIEKTLFNRIQALKKDLDCSESKVRRKMTFLRLKLRWTFCAQAHTDLAMTDRLWVKKGGEIILVAPTARFKVPAAWKNKTAAYIVAEGNAMPAMFSVSGYGNAPSGHPHQCLDNELFTARVMQFCKLVNFCLPGKRNDNGAKAADPKHVGRWYAGHCEKKLAVWWIMEQLKHKFGRQGDVNIADYAKLREIRLPRCRRHAVIVLDRNPCFGGMGKCAEFLIKVEKATGIHISIEVNRCVGFLQLAPTGNGQRRWIPEQSGSADVPDDDDHHHDEDGADDEEEPETRQQDQENGAGDGQRGDGKAEQDQDERQDQHSDVSDNTVQGDEIESSEQRQHNNSERNLILQLEKRQSCARRESPHTTCQTCKQKPAKTAGEKHPRGDSIDSSGGDMANTPTPPKKQKLSGAPNISHNSNLEKPIKPRAVYDSPPPVSREGKEKFFDRFPGTISQLLQDRDIDTPETSLGERDSKGGETWPNVASTATSDYSRTLREQAKRRKRDVSRSFQTPSHSRQTLPSIETTSMTRTTMTKDTPAGHDATAAANNRTRPADANRTPHSPLRADPSEATAPPETETVMPVTPENFRHEASATPPLAPARGRDSVSSPVVVRQGGWSDAGQVFQDFREGQTKQKDLQRECERKKERLDKTMIETDLRYHGPGVVEMERFGVSHFFCGGTPSAASITGNLQVEGDEQGRGPREEKGGGGISSDAPSVVGRPGKGVISSRSRHGHVTGDTSSDWAAVSQGSRDPVIIDLSFEEGHKRDEKRKKHVQPHGSGNLKLSLKRTSSNNNNNNNNNNNSNSDENTLRDIPSIRQQKMKEQRRTVNGYTLHTYVPNHASASAAAAPYHLDHQNLPAEQHLFLGAPALSSLQPGALAQPFSHAPASTVPPALNTANMPPPHAQSRPPHRRPEPTPGPFAAAEKQAFEACIDYDGHSGAGSVRRAFPDLNQYRSGGMERGIRERLEWAREERTGVMLRSE